MPMPKPKPPKPPTPRALPSYTVADLPLAAGKANHLVVLKADDGTVVSLAISNGLTWLTVPVAGEVVLPPKPGETL
jgi:hypothetical protein